MKLMLLISTLAIALLCIVISSGEPVHQGSIRDDFTVDLEASDDELSAREVPHKSLAKKDPFFFGEIIAIAKAIVIPAITNLINNNNRRPPPPRWRRRRYYRG